MPRQPTAIGRTALQPRPMTPDQVADLVARAKAIEARARLDGFAKQAASCRATWAARRRAS